MVRVKSFNVQTLRSKPLKKTVRRTSNRKRLLKVGDKVQARYGSWMIRPWQGFNPGCVENVNQDGTYGIRFDADNTFDSDVKRLHIQTVTIKDNHNRRNKKIQVESMLLEGLKSLKKKTSTAMQKRCNKKRSLVMCGAVRCGLYNTHVPYVTTII